MGTILEIMLLNLEILILEKNTYTPPLIKVRNFQTTNESFLHIPKQQNAVILEASVKVMVGLSYDSFSILNARFEIIISNGL